jgi:hypothetical protein
MHGNVQFSRYVLLPKTQADKDALFKLEHKSMIVPLDEYLGISGLPFKMTVKLMLEIAYWAQCQCSYEKAKEAICKTLGLKINDDTVRKVANTIGKIIFDHDCRNAEHAYSLLNSGNLSFPARKQKGVLYIEVDGAMLNTRQKDEHGSTWRENKLGVVFSSNNIRYWIDKQGQRQHTINRREYVSYVGSAQEFQKHLFACALRNGYGTFEKTVLISDGATWIRNMKEYLFPDAQQILDYYHLCENVNDFAKAHFKMDEAKYRPWGNKICQFLKEGNATQVLSLLESMSMPSESKRLRGYISNNLNNIDYPEYLKNGYFIGSGVIESGNKVVLQNRLKRAGMRWNSVTAQYLLTLKSKFESNLWNAAVMSPIIRHYTLNAISRRGRYK